MRKFLIVAGLLAGAALLTTGSATPANATWVGCSCVKLGAPAVCSKGPVECGATGGACLLPCDYVAPKKAKHHHHKKAKAAKKEMKKQDKK